MIQYVVFDLTTGEPTKWGQCQPELLDAQAEAGQRALATSALNVEGNRSVFWQDVKTVREAHLNGGASTPFGAVDSNEVARSNITGAALAATLSKSVDQPFSVNWTMLDNSVEALDADQMIGLALAVLAHVNACHDRARALRGQIDAATDMAELLAIDIQSGWPSLQAPEPLEPEIPEGEE